MSHFVDWDFPFKILHSFLEFSRHGRQSHLSERTREYLLNRRIVQPSMDTRSASADWERQRDHEAWMEDGMGSRNDFVDSGAALCFFSDNKRRILDDLGGSYEHRG